MRIVVIGLAALVLSGCLESFSLPENDYKAYGMAGTIGGGLLGAGTGALIGSMISNGDIGASALTGLGVGAAAGLVLGTGYVALDRYTALEGNATTIADNQERIDELQTQVEQERAATLVDNATIEFDPANRQQRYLGPTIGVYK